MATLIEYANKPSLFPSLTKRIPIGYLTENPNTHLSAILPKYHVVDFMGIPIPSKSIYPNQNTGLILSSVPDGIGLNGSLYMFDNIELFQQCRHPPFTIEEKTQIVDEMKKRLVPQCRNQKPLVKNVAETYSLIFDILGHSISPEEIIQLSNPSNYDEQFSPNASPSHKTFKFSF